MNSFADSYNIIQQSEIRCEPYSEQIQDVSFNDIKGYELINTNNHSIASSEITHPQFLKKFEFDFMNKKHKNHNNTVDILTNVIKNNSQGTADFLHILKKKLFEKKLLFIRHAEAEHNAYFKSDQTNLNILQPVFDPKITELGDMKCQEMANTIKNLKFQIDIVFISPLRRTLQTLENIKKYVDFPHVKSFIVTELIREFVLDIRTHIGHSLTNLKEVFKTMDYLNYDYILKEFWWCPEHGADEVDCHHRCFVKETKNEFRQRLALFLIWFILREEKNACLISHSKVFRFINGLLSKHEKSIGLCEAIVIDNENIIKFISEFLKEEFTNIDG